MLVLAVIGCFSGSGTPPALVVPVLPEATPPLDGRTISSPYGPRRARGQAEFHLGLDWDGTRGEPVRAALPGRVRIVREPTRASESLMVILEHEVAPYRWQGDTHEVVFTSYHHLDTATVEEDQVVAAGEALGTMGDSGDTDRAHLHFEVRLGTHCSLEYQLDNPESSCVTGFSPHVDPMMILPASGIPPTYVWEGSEATVSATLSDPDIRRVETDLGTVDFVEWIGLSNGSNDERDNTALGWVTLEPLETDTSRHIRFQFAREPAWVEVYDVHGIRGERSDIR